MTYAKLSKDARKHISKHLDRSRAEELQFADWLSEGGTQRYFDIKDVPALKRYAAKSMRDYSINRQKSIDEYRKGSHGDVQQGGPRPGRSP